MAAFTSATGAAPLSSGKSDIVRNQGTVTGVALDVSLDRFDASYAIGDALRLMITASQNAFLTVLDIGASGKIIILLPNSRQTSNLATGGRPYELPEGKASYQIRVNGPPGFELIKVLASRTPVDLLEGEKSTPPGAFRMLEQSANWLARDIGQNRSSNLPSGLAAAEVVFRIVDKPPLDQTAFVGLTEFLRQLAGKSDLSIIFEAPRMLLAAFAVALLLAMRGFIEIGWPKLAVVAFLLACGFAGAFYIALVGAGPEQATAAKGPASSATRQAFDIHADEVLIAGDLTYGTEYSGPKSLDDCQHLCRANAKCLAFTFDPAQQRCFEKSTVSELHPFPSAITGIKRTASTAPSP